MAFPGHAKTYKIIPGVQIIGDEFKVGQILECYVGSNPVPTSQYFTDTTKAAIIEKIKKVNGFTTKTQKLIDDLLEGIDVD